MNKNYFNNNITNKTILVSPLNWGLGHSTRCIPIISELINCGCKVIIATNGESEILLNKAFPKLEIINLPSYNVKYSKFKWWLTFSLFLQTPKLLYQIFIEHQCLKKIIINYKIDAIISDNRFGMFHKKVPSIFITHQLSIQSKFKFLDKFLQKINYFFINKFTVFWVPDYKQENNIAGKLSHPKTLPKIPVKYLGILSRFEQLSISKIYDVAFILSGPEPQRSIFEKNILNSLKTYTGKALLVRGLPNQIENLKVNSNIKVENYLNADELNRAILQSNIIICRSGYTSIMDLIKLQKNAFLIPTPGQTEQEYLANYLQEKRMFFYSKQAEFDLNKILQSYKTNISMIPNFDTNQFKIVLHQFLNAL